MSALSIYDALTEGRSRFVRVEELCRLAAERHPGSLPDREALEAESRLPQKDKKGLEKAHGEFLAAILEDATAGMHLCHAMLLPREESKRRLLEFDERGEIELHGAHLKRQGNAAVLTMRNPRHLNAEDESTLEGMETAVDVALLDRKTEICVLRGAPVEHRKYGGRRLFGAGINLTHLYQGKVRYL